MLQLVSINNFRNIEQIHIEPKQLMCILVGQNGQGKTNILEAIHCLSIGETFRANNIYEAIKFNQTDFHIEGMFNQIKLKIDCANMPRKQTKYSINDVNKTHLQYLNHFVSVLFSPEDKNLIIGLPAKRRDYIDQILYRLDPEYTSLLKEYEKILKQRNALLKQIQINQAGINQLDIWNDIFVSKAVAIWEKRQILINKWQTLISPWYQQISTKSENVSIQYLPKHDSNNILQDLQQRVAKDVILGTTTIGPHRDDFKIFLQDKTASEYASQGEIRSLVLACKFVEIALIEDNKDINVCLLLDDVFSELDQFRQSALLEMSQNRQTFISTTHLESFFPLSEIYHIQAGNIKSFSH